MSLFSTLFHHYPHALHDLLHHEDKTLVTAGLQGLKVTRPSSAVSIEKERDASISRSSQNFELLIKDYLHTLPDYTAETAQGEALLEHWRKIISEQPHRIAEAHLESWNNERSRHFWQERLSHYKTDFGIHADHFPTALDDWERAAGTVIVPAKALGHMQEKQWQDLLIRQRIHNLELYNTGHRKTPS